ncbi:MAG: hypothetical protein HY319_09755 [Armatimonadetes bacterium]|nr:hypothetical protein [Armatimonadota bacterium]
MDQQKSPRIQIEDLPQELPPAGLAGIDGGIVSGGLLISSSLLGGCQAIGGIATQVNL